MSRGKTLSEKDFKIIKTLLNNGLSIKQVVQVTTWKDTSVRYLQLADVLEQDTPLEKEARQYKLFGRK